MRSFSKICAALSLCLLQTVGAIEIDFKSTGQFLGVHDFIVRSLIECMLVDSIKKGASTIAYDMMTYYQGNLTGFPPGVLPAPYYVR